MAMRLDTQLWGLADAAARAGELAALGLDGVFTFEGPHDVFTPLVLATPVGGLDLYTNVAIALPRNPVQLAHQAWDLQALSQGSFSLGLGSQVKAQVERRYGAAFTPPVARMREMVAALRAIFDTWQHGTRLDFQGEYWSHTLMTPLFNPGPLEWGPPPILLGGLGPKMVEMAATVADGLLVMPFCTKRFLDEHTLVAVERGLDAGGRSRSEFEVICEVIISCGQDEAEQAQADAAVRMLLGFYGSTKAYRPVLDAHGWGDRQGDLNTLARNGGWDEMSTLIDDEMLATIAISGNPAEVADQIIERFGEVADRVAFYFPYAIADATIAEIVTCVRAADERSGGDEV